MICKHDLEVLATLQESRTMKLDDLAKEVGQSLSSVRRSIAALNDISRDVEIVSVSGRAASVTLTYRQYQDVVRTIPLRRYALSQQERVEMVLARLLVEDVVNLSELYASLGYSMGTRKLDSKLLAKRVDCMGLSLATLRRRGTALRGDELWLRLALCQLVAPCLDIDNEGLLSPRRANSPAQDSIASSFLQTIEGVACEARNILGKLLSSRSERATYTSYKLALAYTSFALHRMRNGNPLEKVALPDVAIHHQRALGAKAEDLAMSLLLALLDYVEQCEPPCDERLNDIARLFIERIQEGILTHISDDHRLFADVYRLLHRFVIQRYFGIDTEGFVLEEAGRQHYQLLGTIAKAASVVETAYDIQLTEHQLSTLALVFRTYTTRNKQAGRNTKHVVVVSSLSIETVRFFIEQLKVRVDVELSGLVTINELKRLNKLTFDHLVAFSNRITTILDEEGLSCLRLSFYPDENDFKKLTRLGFSTSHRKLKAKSVVEDLKRLPDNEWESYLLERHSDFFLE